MMSKVFSVTNKKGGTAKTTSALNLAAALHAAGKRVLMIDNDHQGNLTAANGLTPAEQKYTLANLLLAAIDCPEDIDLHLDCAVLRIKDGLDLVPANRRLTDAAARLQVMQLSQYSSCGNAERYCEQVMDGLLASLKYEYDYIIIDCGLQHELLTINALAASDYCIIPVQAHFLASEGIPNVLEMVHSVQARFNPKLQIAGILLTMYQSRPQLCQSVRESVSEIYGQDFHVFERPIEYSIKVAECPAAGCSIFEHAPKNAAAESYRSPPPSPVAIRDLPLDRLTPFFTADIGFKPYPPSKLKAFAEQLSEEGLMVRVIVRTAHDDAYEILAGHNRVNAAKLAGWTMIPAEIVEADDARAIMIATSTNLIQRQELSIIERGKAYRALLEAKNRNGQRNALAKESFGDSRQSSNDTKEQHTLGENRQRYNARKLVAEFFGVTEYEIRKAVKLTCLIPELADILENNPKQLNLACADLIADYDAESQQAFIEICSIIGAPVNKAAIQHIVRRCPPPTAEKQSIFEAYREARRAAEKHLAALPRKISFDRRKFAPYLDKLGSDQELENLFLEFLRERVG